MSQRATVTPLLPNNPLLKRTRGIAMALVMFTCLLGSLANSGPSPPCFGHGTSTDNNKICVCTWQDHSGSNKHVVCDIKTHEYPDGQVTFQSIVVSQQQPLSFNAGKQLCEVSEMSMGTPWSMEENEYIRTILPSGHDCWIGISDKQEKENWIYVS
eukprot:Tbor_TRINITY_DN5640_c0_g2::TRINITY_DN5640_c0_g2_i1::g.8494::m.8494